MCKQTAILPEAKKIEIFIAEGTKGECPFCGHSLNPNNHLQVKCECRTRQGRPRVWKISKTQKPQCGGWGAKEMITFYKMSLEPNGE